MQRLYFLGNIVTATIFPSDKISCDTGPSKTPDTIRNPGALHIHVIYSIYVWINNRVLASLVPTLSTNKLEGLPFRQFIIGESGNKTCLGFTVCDREWVDSIVSKTVRNLSIRTNAVMYRVAPTFDLDRIHKQPLTPSRAS